MQASEWNSSSFAVQGLGPAIVNDYCDDDDDDGRVEVVHEL